MEMLLQSYPLLAYLTAFENVTFGCGRGVLNVKIARRVADALKLVQLLDAGPGHVMLLDEPLSALDADLRASVRSALKALHERLPNLAILCVTPVTMTRWCCPTARC